MPTPRPADLGAVALTAVPAVATAYLAFSAGGFFPEDVAAAVVFTALALVVHTTLHPAPFAGLGRAATIALGAMSCLGIWTLLSQSWSIAPSRSLLEFDRVVLYLLTLLAVASVCTAPSRARWAVRLITLALALVVGMSAITRLLPEAFPTEASLEPNRLSFPVTYWNGLGLMAAGAIVLAFRMAADPREPLAARVTAAFVLPLLPLTLYFTFARAATAACAVGLVGLVVLARSVTTLTTALACGPPAAVALVVAYRADALASTDPATAEAASQGRNVALVVLICMGVAAALQFAASRTEPRLARRRRAPRRVAITLAATAGLCCVAAALVAGLPGYVERQYDAFIGGAAPQVEGDLRNRFTTTANNGRTDQWNVALDAFRSERLHGTGAGTYQLEWERSRPVTTTIKDAHSLYIETLGDLGIIGLVLILVLLGAVLAAGATRARGPDRVLGAGVFAGCLVWVLHAGVDWDWELTSVSLWFFVLAGVAVARPSGGEADAAAPTNTARIVLALAWIGFAIPAGLIAVAQGHLVRASDAYYADDCKEATSAARSAINTISTFPQPYEILGYCALERSARSAGVNAMSAAVKREPANWRLSAGLAIARGDASLDASDAARRTLELNPRDDAAKAVARELGGGDSSAARVAKARRAVISSRLVGDR